LRYFNVGWNYDLKRRMLDWYEGTKSWEGGHSFAPYLANIVGAGLPRYRPEERKRLLAEWKKRPYAASLLIERGSVADIDGFEEIVSNILKEASTSGGSGNVESLVTAAVGALGKSDSPAGRKVLHQMFDQFPDRRDQLARAMAERPADADWPFLIRALAAGDSTTLQLAVRGLNQTAKKRNTPQDIRAVILAGLKLGAKRGDNAVGLLNALTKSNQKTGKDFQTAMVHFQNWYHEKFPDAVAATLPKENSQNSKYTFNQLVAYLEGNGKGKTGNVQKGREVFTKAKCVKCHRFLKEGETIGPDLTSLRRRFQRKEIIESLVHPSQVISDQYRMVTVVTVDGLIHNGMPVPGGAGSDKLVLLLSDATKIEIPKKNIDEQAPSKISVMPVGLLKDLTLEQLADLFAFLETSKFNELTPRDASKMKAKK